MERELAKLFPEIRELFPQPFTKKDPALSREEALIEVLRLKDEDSVYYLHYLLFPSKRKQEVKLYVKCVNTGWEEKALRAYEILRSPGVQLTGVAYRQVWGFVDDLLSGRIKRLYFSPDSIYYRINLATLYNDKTFVGDRCEVRYVASSRRLLLKRRKPSSRLAVVIGNPAFDHATQQSATSRTRQKLGTSIAPLPGAEQEAKEIASILGVSPIIGLVSPRLLHIATHGYFIEGEGAAYLRSGLLLAGAAVWNAFYPPPGVEDGRLTAWEVSAMNLWGTQLVTLSACETGLGDITGEGLYGLQRAFLEAGASAGIDTLWPMDDTATKELMTRFYQNWVKAGDKAEVEIVFAETLKDFRQRYRDPYYWGAFILMR